MEVKDMVGMMSTGALLALGIVFVVDKLGSEEPAPQAATLEQPAPQLNTSPEVATFAQTQPQTLAVEEPQDIRDEVTSADINLLGQTTASQLDRIVALSQQGFDQTEQLTPEQEQIVGFFEKTARDMNQQDRAAPTGDVRFSNMAVRGLNVRYFYRVPRTYDQTDTAQLLEDQRVNVRETLCGNDAIRTLLSEYGFAYTYTYVSSDSRMLGRLSADENVCL